MGCSTTSPSIPRRRPSSEEFLSRAPSALGARRAGGEQPCRYRPVRYSSKMFLCPTEVPFHWKETLGSDHSLDILAHLSGRGLLGPKRPRAGFRPHREAPRGTDSVGWDLFGADERPERRSTPSERPVPGKRTGPSESWEGGRWEAVQVVGPSGRSNATRMDRVVPSQKVEGMTGPSWHLHKQCLPGVHK